VNLTIHAGDVLRLAKLDPAGFERHDNARDRRYFLPILHLECDACCRTSIHPNHNRPIRHPFTIDAALARTCTSGLNVFDTHDGDCTPGRRLRGRLPNGLTISRNQRESKLSPRETDTRRLAAASWC
jgi:hypothetical protein